MTLNEAIFSRHSVRAYQDKPIAEDAVEILQKEIETINAGVGLHVQLVLDEPRAFQSRLAKYGKFSGCSNYIVMAGNQL